MTVELPRGWASSTLKSVVLSVGYGFTASATVEEVGPKLLRITDVQDGRVDWESVPYCNCSNLERFGLKAGDIVVARTGATTGKSFVVRDVPEDAVFASYLIRLKTSQEAPAEYVGWYMQTPGYWDQITRVSKGTAQPGANASILSNLEIPIAPVNEQRRIVAKIEALMARSARAKEALDAIPALLDRYRQSVLAAAFRGDLTADWRAQHPDVEPASELLARIRAQRRLLHNQTNHSGRSKRYQEPARQEPNDLPDLPRSWLWVRWEEVGFCQNGRAFPSADYTDDGVKLLRPGNLHVSGNVEWTEKNTRCLPERYADDHPSHLVGPNELIMNLTAQSLADEFLGRACLTDRNEHCLLNQRLARLTPVELSPNFCLWLFKSPVFRRYVEAGLNTGSLIQHMFTSNVDHFVFPLPPAAEQDAIVEAVERHLTARDIVGAEVCRAAAALPKLDQSILAKAFRGELVPQDPNDEPASELLARIKAERAANGTPSRRGGRRKRAAALVA